MMERQGCITAQEMALTRECIQTGKRYGADQMRVSLNKSTLDSITVLNGEIDKVTRCSDRSLFFYIFAGGRYGTYSTNRFDPEDLDDFIRKAIANVALLSEDHCRKLPSPERTAQDAKEGTEAGLYDEKWHSITPEMKARYAIDGSIFMQESAKEHQGWSIISEECEYSDSVDDNYVVDSQGFEGRHTETSQSYWSEVTICDAEGRKYSGYWWESSAFMMKDIHEGCSRKALEQAVRQIGPKRKRSGKYTMIVDNNCSSRLISPIIGALNAGAIQQKSSFLEDSIGKKVFSENFTLRDLARTFGMPGARLFDTEGVATKDRDIILNGEVKCCFTNTYMAEKTGWEPNIEGISRPVVDAFIIDNGKKETDGEIDLERMLRTFGNGIYVTGFNGGNCNSTTGNFSYGVEGFAFRNGKIVSPVKEMVITGNMTLLWNSLAAAGNDAREGARWRIPTLAFEGVDFSA
ncbi:MAG: TldD/PmbA family protein [Candidatus Cryptobacteroides sp.]